MSVDRLIWAVVALTSAVAACITVLTIWRPGDNAAVITAILGVTTPTLSVLVILLQGQKTALKVDEVKQEARIVANVAIASVEGAKDSARKATVAVEKVADTVNKIQYIVNGRQDALQQRITELEKQLRGPGG